MAKGINSYLSNQTSSNATLKNKTMISSIRVAKKELLCLSNPENFQKDTEEAAQRSLSQARLELKGPRRHGS